MKTSSGGRRWSYVAIAAILSFVACGQSGGTMADGSAPGDMQADFAVSDKTPRKDASDAMQFDARPETAQPDQKVTPDVSVHDAALKLDTPLQGDFAKPDATPKPDISLTDANCKGDATANCYTGPTGTLGISVCKAGTQICISGSWGLCLGQVLPTTEICDGKDNNCDGKIDEPFTNLGQPCSVGVGECKSIGVYQCKTDGSGTECSAKPGASASEICDGKDNDCDGQIDENLTKACYSGQPGTQGVGICKAGIETCLLGAWSPCAGEVLPAAEACDNSDNDCDGLVDEGLTKSCYTGPTGTQGVGECKAGAQTCSSGSWGTCVGEVKPTTELCDNKDNDCDGQTDETFGYLGAPCSVGVGECEVMGVFTCTDDGLWDTKCSAKPGVPKPEICDGKDNNCNGAIDDGIPCGSGCKLYTWSGHTYGHCIAPWQTWTDAASHCKYYGGRLATINSLAEDNFLRPLTVGYTRTWIGFNDISTEGSWVWESGESVTYTGWASGEPNNEYGVEDCGQYYDKLSYLWNDGNCNDKWPFICEWNY